MTTCRRWRRALALYAMLLVCAGVLVFVTGLIAQWPGMH